MENKNINPLKTNPLTGNPLPKLPKTEPGMVDSRRKKLNIGEIVRKAALETKSRFPPDMVGLILAKELTDEHATHKQLGNTLFVMHPVQSDPKYIYMRALNADTAENYTQNAVAISKWLYDQGYDYMVSRFEDPALLKLFQFVSKRPPQAGMGYKAVKTKDGMIQVTVKLGPERG